ncbi:MAG TPA: peptidoglycan DD-metalloendopeptidase family protein [Burkholderiaceae bacterium]|nr:peptidoglycan DD-metalloendopeptidase family protein [Burkholderiaceae bacterium]HPE00730.1 peptidoglycan DD-metalloendopeptidase family protein [Burkholderiaceae bacterium]HRZ00904.1 peptidoglycan DD-metalloendopeptidase family protein [Burkholderiaceae bacterium]
MKPAEILSKHALALAARARAGASAAVAAWERIDPKRRSRIELAGILSLLPLSAAIAALAAVPAAADLDNLPQQTITQALAVPELADQISELAERMDSFVREARIQRGDTAASLFERLEIDDPEAARYLRGDGRKAATQLLPGRFVQARVRHDGRLMSLKLFLAADLDAPVGQGRMLVLERSAGGKGLQLSERQFSYERRVEMRAGEIGASLFGATDAAGVPDSVAQQMIEALEAELDFASDLRRGDTFRVVYETLHVAGEYLRPGRLLAVEFLNAGQRHEAYWFGGDGTRNGGFYALDGSTTRRAFLRSPLEFSRVSSGFSGNRTHPVFGYTAAHAGVDMSAPTGTKIRTVADGIVTRQGFERGYGNVVEVRHDSRHATVYAHMSGFAPGMRVGAKVGRGDVIGYVGATGWATGPHLHYEVRINGAPVNPMTAKLPEARPLNGTQLASLREAAGPLQGRLALLDRVVRVAQTDAGKTGAVGEPASVAAPGGSVVAQ